MSTEVTVKKSKKAKNKPTPEKWPDAFGPNGIKTRTNYTKPPKSEDVAKNYVPWTQVASKTYADFVKFVNNDQERLLSYALAGYNAEQRQAAAFGEQRIASMVKKVMEMNPKLSREKAEQRVRAMLAES